MKESKWIISKEYVSDLTDSIVYIDAKYEDSQYSATVKWDGCISLCETVDYGSKEMIKEALHICDLDKFIEMLEDLRDNIERKVVI